MSFKEYYSPLSPSNTSSVICKYDVSYLSKSYKKQLDFDLSDHLERLSGTKEVFLLRCSKTGYEYFFPYDFQGDNIFYECITKNPNYYSANRWEWNFVASRIDHSDKVLDIGAGNLQFMRMVSGAGISIEGLEVNPRSILLAKHERLLVHESDVSSFAKHSKNKYDVITSFHVLEHISDVSSFIVNCIELLNPDGKLILAVPNNDSFLKIDKSLALNLPPHHMGRWTPSSIKQMAFSFNLEVIDIVVEPYSDAFVDWNYQCIYRASASKFGVFGKVFSKLFAQLIKFYLKRNISKQAGPSFLAILKIKN